MGLVVLAHQGRVNGEMHSNVLGATAGCLDGHCVGRRQFIDGEPLHRHLLGTRDEQSHLLVIKLVALAVTGSKSQYHQPHNKISYHSHNHNNS